MIELKIVPDIVWVAHQKEILFEKDILMDAN